MKKFIIILITTISLFFISGCSIEDENLNNEFDITKLISYINGDQRNYEYTYTRNYTLENLSYNEVYVTKVDDSIEYTEHTIATTTITNLTDNTKSTIVVEEYRVLIGGDLYLYTKPNLKWETSIVEYEESDISFNEEDFIFKGEYYSLVDSKKESLGIDLELYSNNTIKFKSNLVNLDVYNFGRVSIILPNFDINN